MDVEELQAPLRSLPPVEFACAYGSAVFPQPGRNNHEPMVDYILGVADPIKWHTENLMLNRRHYSGLMAYFGAKSITQVAEVVGAGVHFNAFLPWQNKKIKYGIIRMDELITDLLVWHRYYISGRLQKPVQLLIDTLDVRNINTANLQAAVSTALLLLPPEFTEEDLFIKICGLSYMGDLRMFFAEDKHKVQKIVQGNADRFHNLYKDQISRSAELGLLKLPSFFGDPRGLFVQDFSASATSTLVSFLPPSVRSHLAGAVAGKTNVNMTDKEVYEAVAGRRHEIAESMTRIIKSRVRTSSLKQALSGFLAVGGVNAMNYLAKKVSKAWSSGN